MEVASKLWKANSKSEKEITLIDINGDNNLIGQRTVRESKRASMVGCPLLSLVCSGSGVFSTSSGVLETNVEITETEQVGVGRSECTRWVSLSLSLVKSNGLNIIVPQATFESEAVEANANCNPSSSTSINKSGTRVRRQGVQLQSLTQEQANGIITSYTTTRTHYMLRTKQHTATTGRVSTTTNTLPMPTESS
jgi:hypothetical protein